MCYGVVQGGGRGAEFKRVGMLFAKHSVVCRIIGVGVQGPDGGTTG